MISRSRILVAEESHARALLVKYYLEKFGFVSVVASLDSKWALEEVINVSETSDRYDLIICDYQMRHCSGIDILSELRSSEEIEYTKFLMLIDHGDLVALERSLGEKADACLEKPFSEINLIEKVVELFKDPFENTEYNHLISMEALRKESGRR